MVDLASPSINQAIDDSFDTLVDQIVDEHFEASLVSAESPAEFHVASVKLGEASHTAAAALPTALRFEMLGSSALRSRGIVASATAFGAAAAESAGTVDSDRVVEEAGESERGAAARKIRELICGELKDWFDARIEQIRTWFSDLGLAGTVKKIGETAKALVGSAVTAIAAVVGAQWLAWLLIGVAVAAVCAAVYFLVRKGLPNYCAV